MKKQRETGQLLRFSKLNISLLLVTFLTLLVGGASVCFAQPNPQLGEIEFNEDVKDSTVNLSKKEATSFVNSLVTAINGNSASSVPEVSDRAISYLNASYLYCTIQKGTCQGILDGLMESEILHAMAQKEARCRLFPRFWRSWLNGKFEERQKYQTKTGFLSEASNFTNNIRPRYVKCDQTLKEIMNSNPTFSQRYGDKGEGRAHVMKLHQFFKVIDEQRLNVFAETDSLITDITPTSSTSKK